MTGVRPLLLLTLLTGTGPVVAQTPAPGFVADLCVSGNTDVFEARSTQSSDSPADCIEKCSGEGSTHMGLTDNACYCGRLKIILPSDTNYDPENCMPCPSSTEYTCGRAGDDSLYVYLLQGTSITVKVNASMNPSPATTGSRSLIPAVAWVVGCFAIFIVVLVGVACRWYIKRRKNNSAKMDQPQNVLINHHQQKTVANLPDVASDEYEEIGEPDYLGHNQKSIADPADGPSINKEHKMLQARSTKFDDWVKRNHIPQTIQDKLHSQTIVTIEDLKKLKKKDILELSLTIGDRNNLKAALKNLK